MIQITLNESEAALILEALEMDQDIYLQSARDAVADGSHDLAMAFGTAAERICTFRTRLRRVLDRPPVRQ